MSLTFKTPYFVSFFILLLIVLTISCTNLTLREKNIIPYLNDKNFGKAIKNIQKNRTKTYSKRNLLLYYLDLGTLYHYAQKYDSSNVYLKKGLDTYNTLYTRSILTQSLSSLLDSEITPYRSYPYEIISTHQMISLNYQALQKPYESLVETRQAQLKFDTWEKESSTKYHNDGSFNFLSFLYYVIVNEKSNGLISLYQSVRSFQHNPTNLPQIVREEAVHLFSKYQRKNDLLTLKISKKSQNFKSILQKNNSDSIQIIIIGYAGKGPIFKDEIWSGTFSPIGILQFYHYDPKTDKTQIYNLSSSQIATFQTLHYTSTTTERSNLLKTYHIKLALPSSVLQDSKTRHFKIYTDSQQNSFQISETLTDYYKLSEQYLTDNKKNIFIRTIIRVAFKTSVAQIMKNTLSKGHNWGFFTDILVDVTNDLTETSDTRNLFSLPKTVEISSITIPIQQQKIIVQPIDKDGQHVSSPLIYKINSKAGSSPFLFISSFK